MKVTDDSHQMLEAGSFSAANLLERSVRIGGTA
jgi:hypothetical protein